MRRWRSVTVAAILLATCESAAIPAAPTAVQASTLSMKAHLFYYPWYGSPDVSGRYRHWQQGGHTPPTDIAANLYPRSGAYDSGDITGTVNQHMACIRRSGVGVIVYSWWGRDSYEDRLVPLILDAASRYGIKVAWHIEPYEGRTAASTAADISYLNSRYGASPAYYRDSAHGNRPAFYVFESLRIADWSPIGPLKADNIVLAHTTDISRVTHFGGMYTYDVLVGLDATGWKTASDYARANGLLWSPSVGPGYIDDRAVPGNTTPTLNRDDGATYDREWRNALNPATGGRPDWVSITSFNEWHEGSVIEPVRSDPPAGFGYLTYQGAYGETGAAAETAYLDRTRYWILQF